jgi:uncharacterized circularly permuted ATP-grasp superfamily protein/uncharacterized alpha-E superfamily protein
MMTAMQRPIFQNYQAGSAYDEAVDASGVLRPHWQFLTESLDALGETSIVSRQADIHRFVRENGVTYNVYSESGNQSRPWPLDLIPVPVDSRDWALLEAGIIQRAELLDLILRDLYGERRLLREHIIPPEVIYGHGGFLRACHGLVPPEKRYLHFYAADLGRKRDGSFRVISDRLQAPSGAGYALENRIVLSRTMPSLYRDSHVHRLALFFRTLRNQFASLAGGGHRIAVLTAGPENETFFEQAFLANYLGFHLVQGSDLSVQDGRVFLKTLGGLRAIDGILRRVDDAFSDPLELRGDSVLGVAGLLYSARAGNIVLINPPGTGVLENPGIVPFLPAIARYFLGQDLRLSSPETYWCGDSLGLVLDRLHEFVIKPIARGRQRDTVYANRLGTEELRALAVKIKAQPWAYTAQEEIELSTAPAWNGNRLEGRPMVVRAFACSAQESYMVMPGGLVRISPEPGSKAVSNQAGGESKDLWILASEPEKQITLLTTSSGSAPLSRSGGEIASRTADNLFWVGRYAERTESLARILREMMTRLSEGAAEEDPLELLMLALEPHTGQMNPALVSAPAADIEERIGSVLFDASVLGGVRFNVNSLLRAARSLRERMSEDAWRTLNRMDNDLEATRSKSESLDNVLIYLSSFSGFVSESMTRGSGFRFLELGRRIERAALLCDFLLSVTAKPVTDGMWEHILKIQNSSMTYRRRYKRMDPRAVIDLLVFDESNPRSAAHQLRRLEQLSTELPSHREAGKSEEERIAIQAASTLRLAEGAEPEGLRELLLAERDFLRRLTNVIASNYFSYVETQQRVEADQWSVTV